jgi:hypothetical protein
MTREELHKQITNEIHEVYKKKDHDYGSSTHDTYQKYGLVSFLVRLEDKLNRLHTLTTTEAKVEDEKIEDTLIDLAGYAILALLELRSEDSE